jgi:hypothetical protein
MPQVQKTPEAHADNLSDGVLKPREPKNAIRSAFNGELRRHRSPELLGRLHPPPVTTERYPTLQLEGLSASYEIIVSSSF